MLIDRPGMLEHMFRGLYQPTTCPFYWASRECDPTVESYPYDRRRAVELLEEAEWRDTDGDGIRDKAGVAFRFTFLIPATSVEAGRMGAKMKEDFARVGIEMDIQRLEWSQYMSTLSEHEFDACQLIWGGGPRGEPTQIWHSSSIDGGSNYVSFRHERADRLMEQARILFEPEPRNALYREFHRILHEEQPYTFLFVRPQLSLVHKKLRGVRQSLYFWRYRDWWLDTALGPAPTAPAHL
jgi:peptide/nickel transport system substrate-binding protein